MEWSFVFFLNSALLGVGLAMDAFSVSMANGLHDPRMSRGTMCRIAGTFALFQAVMPMTGWVCVHTIVELFSSFEKFIPWIALALLGYIGGKMLVDGIKGEEAEEAAELSAGALLMQGVVRFVALYDHEYDPIRLIKQLKRISPLTIYRSGQAMSGPNYQKYMHQILKVYNGSSRSKSLPIKQ